MNIRRPPAPRSRSVSQSRSVTRPRLFNRSRSTTPRRFNTNRPRSTASRPVNFNRPPSRPTILQPPRFSYRPEAAVQPRPVTHLRAPDHIVVNRENPRAYSLPMMRARSVRPQFVNPPLPSDMTPAQLLVVAHNRISNVTARHGVCIHTPGMSMSSLDEFASEMDLFYTAMQELIEFQRQLTLYLRANPN